MLFRWITVAFGSANLVTFEYVHVQEIFSNIKQIRHYLTLTIGGRSFVAWPMAGQPVAAGAYSTSLFIAFEQ